MKFNAKTYRQPSVLKIGVETRHPKKIFLVVRDKQNIETQYTNRYMTVDGKQVFEVLMPVAPKMAEVIVASAEEARGNMVDNDYRIFSLRREPLNKSEKFSANGERGAVNDFLTFAEEFSNKANYLSAGGSVYTSDNGKYKIKYLDVIRGSRGNALKTPARISNRTGMIEVSKEDFNEYTVPMRMAILLHEFSHFYLNDNHSDEIEADMNALAIYLERGYPTIDAYNVFTTVFAESPSDLNKARFKRIDNFIQNYKRN